MSKKNKKLLLLFFFNSFWSVMNFFFFFQKKKVYIQKNDIVLKSMICLFFITEIHMYVSLLLWRLTVCLLSAAIRLFSPRRH